jgi:ABC-type amino acid transport substrate-binding protein
MGDEVKRIQNTQYAIRNKRFVVIGALLVIVLGILYWVFSIALTKHDLAWERIRSRGIITIATDASYPPFSAVDENGNYFGLDIDLGDELARRLGVRADYENIAYDGLIGAIVAGRDEVILSAFVEQPDRLHQVRYTQPYFVGGTLLVTRIETDVMFTTSEAVEQWSAGKVLAVEYGAGGDALARQWARRQTLTVQSHNSADEALQAVANGQAAAALVDALTVYAFLQSNPNLHIASLPLEPEPFVIAVGVDSSELLSALQQTLAAMEADGTLMQLRKKWGLEIGN